MSAAGALPPPATHLERDDSLVRVRPADQAMSPDRGARILPFQELRAAVEDGLLTSAQWSDAQLQPASIDLKLGKRAWRLRCSFLPDRESTVEEKVGDFAIEELDLGDGAILEQNRPYLVELAESVVLPDDVRGRANPKSSAGRVDLFARLVTDRNARFDDVPYGYHGKLFLEVVPRSFLVRVSQGLSLSQLRLLRGRDDVRRHTDADLMELQGVKGEELLFVENTPVEAHDLALGSGLFLGLDLSPDDGGHAGLRARRNSHPIDLAAVGAYAWEDYWEPVRPERGGRLVLEPEQFYLLLSRESVVIPPSLAAEMAAYDPTAGELRTHYAGFFDPGFGYTTDRASPRGSRATLEVRARDVPFMVEHGQPICKLVFEELTQATALLYGADIGSTYQGQRVTLSKHFASQGLAGQLTLPEAARTAAG